MIHGQGNLTFYRNGNFHKKIALFGESVAYYGSIDSRTVRTHEDDTKTIGSITQVFDNPVKKLLITLGQDDITLSGFNVLVRGEEVYIGDFYNNQYYGLGDRYLKGKLAYSGNWSQNKYHGEGVKYYPDGGIKSGTWKHGQATGKRAYEETSARGQLHIGSHPCSYFDQVLDVVRNAKSKYEFLFLLDKVKRKV